MREKKNNKAVLRDIHNVELEIFKVFSDICNRNNLKYFAIQGTTLGAVFWDGFIPWDDDMDIGMPIDDYEKFVGLVRKELPRGYGFLEFEWCGGKMHDMETMFLESSDLSNVKNWHGVFIDIVPLIALPDDVHERDSFCEEIRAYHLESVKKRRYPNESTMTMEEIRKWRNRLVHRYPYGGTKYVTDFSFGYYYKFKASGFKNPIIMNFCSEKIPVSSTYDYDLKSRYGEYKKYPDKKYRYAHSNSLVDLEKSYKKYVEEIKLLPKWVKQLHVYAGNIEGSYYGSFQWLKKQYDVEQKKDERYIYIEIRGRLVSMLKEKIRNMKERCRRTNA